MRTVMCALALSLMVFASPAAAQNVSLKVTVGMSVDTAAEQAVVQAVYLLVEHDDFFQNDPKCTKCFGLVLSPMSVTDNEGREVGEVMASSVVLYTADGPVPFYLGTALDVFNNTPKSIATAAQSAVANAKKQVQDLIKAVGATEGPKKGIKG